MTLTNSYGEPHDEIKHVMEVYRHLRAATDREAGLYLGTSGEHAVHLIVVAERIAAREHDAGKVS